jgi:hypothetical protein
MAPWAYGGTTTQSILAINLIVAAAVGLWLAELALSRRDPALPRALLGTVGALLFLGWWMTWNARAIFDAEFFVFVPLPHFSPALSGSIDYAISAAWMTRATLLLAAACFVADWSRDSIWLMRFWWAIGLAGGSIALLGLLQKATQAEMIFWGPAQADDIQTFFATYYYHANAGAFLNLTFPAVIGMAIRAFTTSTGPAVRAVWASAAVLMVIAVFSNTSKVSQFLAVLLLASLVVGFRGAAWHALRRSGWKLGALTAAAFLLALFGIAQASHLDQPLARWMQLRGQLPDDARWIAARAALHGVPRAGWFGFGPGTFRVAFPYLTGYLGDRAGGVWRFLHEDYLQTLLEWGYIGSGLWAAFFFGGMAFGLRSWLRDANPERWPQRRWFLLPLVILSLGATALHALVDFPFQIASLQLYVASYAGLCWGSGKWGKEAARRTAVSEIARP